MGNTEIANPSYFRWRGVGLLAAWLLAVIAVAGPTWRPEPSPFADDPVPVMLALRAGESMDLSDLAPSRMERARLKIADFAHQRKSLLRLLSPTDESIEIRRLPFHHCLLHH